MPLRNVPITYTLDQQRQEINALASDVNDIDVNFSERVDDRVGALLLGGTGIASTYDDAGGTITLALAFNEFSTSAILEGTNLYYTTARANAAIDARVNQNFVNNLNITNLGPQDSITLSLGQTTKEITPLNYNNVSWDTAYGWGDHNAAGYLTSYTETSTFDDVTDRNSTTTNTVTVGALKTNIIQSKVSSDNLGITAARTIFTNDVRIGTYSTGLSNDFGINFEKTGAVTINHATNAGGLVLRASGTETFSIDSEGKFNGVLKFVTSDGDAGQSLQTDGNGQLVWGSGGGANVNISDGLPTSANTGDLWWESDTGRLKVYYANGANPAAWVDASPPLQADVPNNGSRTNVSDVDASWVSGSTGDVFSDTNGTFSVGVEVSSFSKMKVSVVFGKVEGSNGTYGTIALERNDGSTLSEIATFALKDPGNSASGYEPLSLQYVDTHGASAGDIVTYQLRLKELNASGNRSMSETCQIFVEEV